MATQTEILNFLYKPEYYYEIGWTKNGYFNRNRVISGAEVPNFVGNPNYDDKFILSYPSSEKVLRQKLVYDKIWFDFDVDNPEDFPACEAEVKMFREKLEQDFQIKPYVQFSGSKGFHIYIYFPKPIDTEKKYLQQMLRFLRNKYNLQYVCDSCINGPIRMQRLPFTINKKSGKQCEPHQMDEITTSTKILRLHDICRDIVDKRETQMKWTRIEKQKQYKNQDTSIFEVDPQVVWEDLHGHLVVKRESGLLRSDCPWHDSQSGNSVMVGDTVATCHHCGSFNSYQIVLKYFNGDIKKTMEYLSKYQE